MVAHERCCCGATFEIGAHLTSTVEDAVEKFRADHAACREAWVAAQTPATAPRTVLLEHIAEIARTAWAEPTDLDTWLAPLGRALDNLDRTETA